MEKLLKIDEVAFIARVRPATIYKYCKRGDLPYIKIGPRKIRIRHEDFANYLTKMTQNPQEAA